MPCVFAIQNKARSPFHQTRQWCPQCWQTATLLVTISSRRGGGRFPFRSASCDQITGRNSSLNGHIHQPISSHHAKLWRVAGVREPAPPARHGCGSVDISCKAHPFFCGFAPIIPQVRRLCNHFSGISYCARFSYSSFCAIYAAIVVLIFSGARPGHRLIHRPRCVLPNHKVVDVCLLQHIPCRWNCRIHRALLLRH